MYIFVGSPSGSTPIDALLQNSSVFSGPERGDEIAQTQSVTTRQKSVLIAKNRVSFCDCMYDNVQYPVYECY